MSKKQPKLAIRKARTKGHEFCITLISDSGSFTVSDTRIFPDEDNRSERRNLGYDTMTISEMTRQDLKSLKTAIKEVLKNSK
jgi:hypothetical protein